MNITATRFYSDGWILESKSWSMILTYLLGARPYISYVLIFSQHKAVFTSEMSEDMFFKN